MTGLAELAVHERRRRHPRWIVEISQAGTLIELAEADASLDEVVAAVLA